MKYFIVLLSLFFITSCNTKEIENLNIKISEKDKQIKRLLAKNSQLDNKVKKLETNIQELKEKLEISYVGSYEVEDYEVFEEIDSSHKNWNKIPRKCNFKIEYVNNTFIYYSKGILYSDYTEIYKGENLNSNVSFGGERGFGSFNAYLEITDDKLYIRIDFYEQIFNFDTEAIEAEYKYNALLKLKRK